jgi:hypothetical protein
MANTPVRLERSGDVAVIIVDHPPVNALSLPVREGLVAALAELAADAGLRAAVPRSVRRSTCRAWHSTLRFCREHGATSGASNSESFAITKSASRHIGRTPHPA